MVPYLETNTRKYIVPTKINFLKLLEQCIAEMISIYIYMAEKHE